MSAPPTSTDPQTPLVPNCGLLPRRLTLIHTQYTHALKGLDLVGKREEGGGTTISVEVVK